MLRGAGRSDVLVVRGTDFLECDPASRSVSMRIKPVRQKKKLTSESDFDNLRKFVLNAERR